MRRMLMSMITGMVLLSTCADISAQDIRDRLQGQSRVTYRVTFNAMPSGTLVWSYAGKRFMDGKTVDVLNVSSDTKILKLLNLESDEDIMLDEETFLPVYVERKVKLFGKQEYIQEFYDQDKGSVTVVKNDGSQAHRVIKRNPPIHNILSLLYFFPQSIELKERARHSFNLPTQMVNIEVKGIKKIKTRHYGVMQAYLLHGRGARRFNLWLDVNDRLPLRLEFIVPVGRIVIERNQDPADKKAS